MADKLLLIYEVMKVQTQDDLLARMKSAAADIGFDRVLFGLQLNLPIIGAVQHINSGYPKDFQLLYQAHNLQVVDPTVKHTLTHSEPYEWTETKTAEHSIELMEESRRFGLGFGMCLPVHQGPHAVGLLSLGRDRPFTSDAERQQVIAGGTVLASCVHLASSNIIVPGLLAQQSPHLTPRELECLKLIADGKSNWDIGNILGLSEFAAAFHVKNMLKKMGVSTRQQAVARGVALRLIQ